MLYADYMVVRALRLVLVRRWDIRYIVQHFFFNIDHFSATSLFLRFTFIPFHFISFHQARKLYRAMVLEKKRKEAALVITAYCRGWQVIEM